jgi:hypothetical protein
MLAAKGFKRSYSAKHQRLFSLNGRTHQPSRMCWGMWMVGFTVGMLVVGVLVNLLIGPGGFYSRKK